MRQRRTQRAQIQTAPRHQQAEPDRADADAASHRTRRASPAENSTPFLDAAGAELEEPVAGGASSTFELAADDPTQQPEAGEVPESGLELVSEMGDSDAAAEEPTPTVGPPTPPASPPVSPPPRPSLPPPPAGESTAGPTLELPSLPVVEGPRLEGSGAPGALAPLLSETQVRADALILQSEAGIATLEAAIATHQQRVLLAASSARGEIERTLDGLDGSLTGAFAHARSRVAAAAASAHSALDGVLQSRLDRVDAAEITGHDALQVGATRTAEALRAAIEQDAKGLMDKGPGYAARAKEAAKAWADGRSGSGAEGTLVAACEKKAATKLGKDYAVWIERQLSQAQSQALSVADGVAKGGPGTLTAQVEGPLKARTATARGELEAARQGGHARIDDLLRVANDAIDQAEARHAADVVDLRASLVEGIDTREREILDSLDDAGEEGRARLRAAGRSAGHAVVEAPSALDGAPAEAAAQAVDPVADAVNERSAQGAASLDGLAAELVEGLEALTASGEGALCDAGLASSQAARSHEASVQSAVTAAQDRLELSLLGLPETTETQLEGPVAALEASASGVDAALLAGAESLRARVQEHLAARDLALAKEVDTQIASFAKHIVAPAKAAVDAEKKVLQGRKQALFKAVDGWGTDVAGFHDALRSTSAASMPYLVQIFDDHYKSSIGDLEFVILDEMSGADADIALAYIRGERTKALKLELADSIGMFNDDEDRIRKVLSAADADEIQTLTTDEASKSVLTNVRAVLDGADRDIFDALVDPKLDRDAAKARVTAIQVFEAMDGPGTWVGDVHTALGKAKTAEQRAAVTEAFAAYAKKRGSEWAVGKGSLKAALKDDLSGTDLHVAEGLAEGDKAKVRAARIEEASAWPGTDEEGLFKNLRNDDMKAKKKAANPIAQAVQDKKREEAVAEQSKLKTSFKALYEVDLTERLEGELGSVTDEGNHEAELAANLLGKGEADGALMIQAAIDGAGTNEALLHRALAGKSKTEIKALVADWEKKYGNGAKLADVLLNDSISEVSGGDAHKVRMALLGNAETAADHRKHAQMNARHARGGAVGEGLMHLGYAFGYSDTAKVLQTNEARMNKAWSGLSEEQRKAKQGSGKEVDRFIGLTEMVDQDAELYGAALDSAIDGLITTFELVAGAIATIASGGAASPALAAIIANLGVGATGVVLRKVASGDRMGYEKGLAEGGKALIGALTAGAGELKSLATWADDAAEGISKAAVAKVLKNPELLEPGKLDALQEIVSSGLKQGAIGMGSESANVAIDEQTWDLHGTGLLTHAGGRILQSGVGQTVNGAASKRVDQVLGEGFDEWHAWKYQTASGVVGDTAETLVQTDTWKEPGKALEKIGKGAVKSLATSSINAAGEVGKKRRDDAAEARKQKDKVAQSTPEQLPAEESQQQQPPSDALVQFLAAQDQELIDGGYELLPPVRKGEGALEKSVFWEQDGVISGEQQMSDLRDVAKLGELVHKTGGDASKEMSEALMAKLPADVPAPVVHFAAGKGGANPASFDPRTWRVTVSGSADGPAAADNLAHEVRHAIDQHYQVLRLLAESGEANPGVPEFAWDYASTIAPPLTADERHNAQRWQRELGYDSPTGGMSPTADRQAHKALMKDAVALGDAKHFNEVLLPRYQAFPEERDAYLTGIDQRLAYAEKNPGSVPETEVAELKEQRRRLFGMELEDRVTNAVDAWKLDTDATDEATPKADADTTKDPSTPADPDDSFDAFGKLDWDKESVELAHAEHRQQSALPADAKRARDRSSLEASAQQGEAGQGGLLHRLARKLRKKEDLRHDPAPKLTEADLVPLVKEVRHWHESDKPGVSARVVGADGRRSRDLVDVVLRVHTEGSAVDVFEFDGRIHVSLHENLPPRERRRALANARGQVVALTGDSGRDPRIAGLLAEVDGLVHKQLGKRSDSAVELDLLQQQLTAMKVTEADLATLSPEARDRLQALGEARESRGQPLEGPREEAITQAAAELDAALSEPAPSGAAVLAALRKARGPKEVQRLISQLQGSYGDGLPAKADGRSLDEMRDLLVLVLPSHELPQTLVALGGDRKETIEASVEHSLAGAGSEVRKEALEERKQLLANQGNPEPLAKESASVQPDARKALSELQHITPEEASDVRNPLRRTAKDILNKVDEATRNERDPTTGTRQDKTELPLIVQATNPLESRPRRQAAQIGHQVVQDIGRGGKGVGKDRMNVHGAREQMMRAQHDPDLLKELSQLRVGSQGRGLDGFVADHTGPGPIDKMPGADAVPGARSAESRKALHESMQLVSVHSARERIRDHRRADQDLRLIARTQDGDLTLDDLFKLQLQAQHAPETLPESLTGAPSAGTSVADRMQSERHLGGLLQESLAAHQQSTAKAVISAVYDSDASAIERTLAPLRELREERRTHAQALAGGGEIDRTLVQARIDQIDAQLDSQMRALDDAARDEGYADFDTFSSRTWKDPRSLTEKLGDLLPGRKPRLSGLNEVRELTDVSRDRTAEDALRKLLRATGAEREQALEEVAALPSKQVLQAKRALVLEMLGRPDSDLVDGSKVPEDGRDTLTDDEVETHVQRLAQRNASGEAYLKTLEASRGSASDLVDLGDAEAVTGATPAARAEALRFHLAAAVQKQAHYRRGEHTPDPASRIPLTAEGLKKAAEWMLADEAQPLDSSSFAVPHAKEAAEALKRAIDQHADAFIDDGGASAGAQIKQAIDQHALAMIDAGAARKAWSDDLVSRSEAAFDSAELAAKVAGHLKLPGSKVVGGALKAIRPLVKNLVQTHSMGTGADQHQAQRDLFDALVAGRIDDLSKALVDHPVLGPALSTLMKGAYAERKGEQTRTQTGLSTANTVSSTSAKLVEARVEAAAKAIAKRYGIPEAVATKLVKGRLAKHAPKLVANGATSDLSALDDRNARTVAPGARRMSFEDAYTGPDAARREGDRDRPGAGSETGAPTGNLPTAAQLDGALEDAFGVSPDEVSTVFDFGDEDVVLDFSETGNGQQERRSTVRQPAQSQDR